MLDEKTIEEVQSICENSTKKPKISIRINCLKTTKINLEENLKNENIQTENGLLENFLYISNAKNLENSKSFKEGLFTVQDEVASLPSLLLAPEPNDIILDACSAPGGKTTYIAELMNKKGESNGEIEAWDIHEHRTKLVEQNAKRLGITNIKTKVKDATFFEKNYVEKFDKILLDVPCMGLGVIKRKPDIKWSKTEEDISGIQTIQNQILETCSQYLKKGGRLVYSTCSIIKEENEKIVEKFLKNHKEFTIESVENKLISTIEREQNTPYLKVYPNDNTDGFFIAILCKNG